MKFISICSIIFLIVLQISGCSLQKNEIRGFFGAIEPHLGDHIVMDYISLLEESKSTIAKQNISVTGEIEEEEYSQLFSGYSDINFSIESSIETIQMSGASMHSIDFTFLIESNPEKSNELSVSGSGSIDGIINRSKKVLYTNIRSLSIEQNTDESNQVLLWEILISTQLNKRIERELPEIARYIYPKRWIETILENSIKTRIVPDFENGLTLMTDGASITFEGNISPGYKEEEYIITPHHHNKGITKITKTNENEYAISSTLSKTTGSQFISDRKIATDGRRYNTKFDGEIIGEEGISLQITGEQMVTSISRKKIVYPEMTIKGEKIMK